MKGSGLEAERLTEMADLSVFVYKTNSTEVSSDTLSGMEISTFLVTGKVDSKTVLCYANVVCNCEVNQKDANTSSLKYTVW